MFIKVKNLSVSLGDKKLFENVDLTLSEKYRYALVGKNGCGKSTFLKLINGEIKPERGEIQIDPPLSKKILMRQFLLIENPQVSTFEYLISQNLEIFNEWKKIQSENTDNIQDVIDKYSELGGYILENNIYSKLGEYKLDKDQKIQNLSGGQKTRLQLINAEIQGAKILLLDEPTNNLDIEGLEIFQKFIESFKGLVILASHDRNLLTESIDIILDFDNGTIKEYSGNYEYYQKTKMGERVAKEERLRLNEKRVAKLNIAAKKLSDKVEKHIERSRKYNVAIQRAARLDKKNKARKTRIVRDKLRLYRDNDKMGRDFLVQRMQVKTGSQRDNLLNRAKSLAEEKSGKIGWSLKLDFNTIPLSSDFAIKIKEVDIGYPEKVIRENINFDLQPGEKVRIKGLNGAGKTTLLKTIAQELKPIKGEVFYSNNLKIGYLEQENLNLDFESRVIDEFMKDAQEMSEGEARSFLHFFLFEGEMPLRKVGTLSEGEKLKLKLAKLLYSKANLLLLDEPTNHLDIPSQEVVEKALKDYTGTLIIVTHDNLLSRNLNVMRIIEL